MGQHGFLPDVTLKKKNKNKKQAQLASTITDAWIFLQVLLSRNVSPVPKDAIQKKKKNPCCLRSAGRDPSQ